MFNLYKMPKLLTIVGDINQSNNTVRAVFNPPVPLPKGSKMGLQSLKVEFRDSSVNDTFTVASTDTITVNGTSVALVAGTYNAETFDQMLTNAIALYCGVATGNVGQNFHVETDAVSSLKTFTMYETTQTSVDFDADFIILAGTPLATTDTFDANGSVVPPEVIGELQIPNASFRFTGAMNVLGSFTMDLYDSVGANPVFGVGVSAGGFWEYRFNGATTVTAFAPVIGDTFTLSRSGSTVTWVFQVGGFNQAAITQTVTYSIQNGINADLGNYVQYFQAPTLSTARVDGLRCTTYNQGIPATTTVCTLTVNPVTSKLARYLGFADVQNHQDTDNPAEVSSTKGIKGDNVTAGFSVVVDPNILESYQSDARDQRRGRQNVLYKVNSDSLGTVIEREPPYLTMLDMNNAAPSQITHLNITFRAASDNRLLQFADSPSLTLVIEN